MSTFKRFFCCFAPSSESRRQREASAPHSAARVHPFQNASTLSQTDASGFLPKKLVKINSMFGTSDLMASEFRSPNFKELRYNCPICFCYYNKILETSCCSNYICHGCSDGLNFRVLANARINVVSCPFCSIEEFTIKDVDPNQRVKTYSDTPMMRSTPRERGFGQIKDLLDYKFSRFADNPEKKEEEENKEKESQIVEVGFASDGFNEFKNPVEKPSRPLTAETAMRTSAVSFQVTPKKRMKGHPTKEESISVAAHQNLTLIDKIFEKKNKGEVQVSHNPTVNHSLLSIIPV